MVGHRLVDRADLLAQRVRLRCHQRLLRLLRRLLRALQLRHGRGCVLTLRIELRTLGSGLGSGLGLGLA